MIKNFFIYTLAITAPISVIASDHIYFLQTMINYVRNMLSQEALEGENKKTRAERISKEILDGYITHLQNKKDHFLKRRVKTHSRNIIQKIVTEIIEQTNIHPNNEETELATKLTIMTLEITSRLIVSAYISPSPLKIANTLLKNYGDITPKEKRFLIEAYKKALHSIVNENRRLLKNPKNIIIVDSLSGFTTGMELTNR